MSRRSASFAGPWPSPRRLFLAFLCVAQKGREIGLTELQDHVSVVGQVVVFRLAFRGVKRHRKMSVDRHGNMSV